MPNYCVIVRNVADTESRTPLAIGGQQVEYCTAPDPETVNEMVQRELSRTCDPSLYTWTITEQP